MSNLDLRELAIDRGSTGRPIKARRRVLTRYVLPLLLVFGFCSLVAWASWDMMFPPRPVTVVPVFSTTAEVRQEGTPLFKAAGWIEPRPTPVRVAALAPGVVEELLVVEDQLLRKGEPVAQMVKDDARLVHERAIADQNLRRAELAEVTATLKAAETRFEQPVHLEAALGEADTALAKIETEVQDLPFKSRSAKAEYEAARQDYESKRASRGVVSGIQIEIARSKMQSAKAMLEELKNRTASLQKEQEAQTARRNALKTQLSLLADETMAKAGAQAKIDAARARVEQARVAVAEAKLRLDRMTITAPVDGRVYQLVTAPGSRIGSGMTQMLGHDGSTVITMYRPELLQVRVDVRFEDIPRVGLGQPVEIDNPALKKPVIGEVLFVSSEADIQKNTLEVKVGIAEPPTVFKPEMLVDVTFLAPEQIDPRPESTQKAKLFVLQQLVQQSDGEAFVWLADQSDGIARRAIVETGVAGTNGLVEIKSGLTISSRVISSNTDALQHGDRIQVTSEDATLGTETSIGGDG